ncbi:MAG: hypothetical protein RLZZ546_69 [Bacteroidota bacterium]|jgi:hypothetical protein
MRLIIILSCYFFTFTLFANNGSNKCEIIIDSVEYRCFDNKTEADSTDDYFLVIVKVSNYSLGITNRYKINVDGVFVNDLLYDSQSEIKILSDRSTHIISVHDYDDETCYKEIKTIQLNPCSIICDLQNKTEIEIHCNNNTTGADPTDDFYSITFGSPGLSYDNQYEVFFDGELKGNFLYNLQNYINHRADSITHEISIRDIDNDSCSITTMLGYFKTCSFDCGLTIVDKNFECNNNNTKLDITDDYYDMNIEVDGYNTSGEYYIFLNDINIGSYKYRVKNKVKIKANGQINNFKIQDVNNATCYANFTSSVLTHCSIDCSLLSLPSSNAGNDKEITCKEPMISIVGSSNLPDNLVTYKWLTPQGQYINNKVIDKIDIAGTYILYASLTDNGCSGKPDTMVVVGNKTIPTAIIALSDTLLSCKTNIINASYIPQTNFEYEFIVNATIINFTSFAIEQASKISLRVTDLTNGCKNETIKNISENKNKPKIKLTSPSYIKCDESYINLKEESLNTEANYTWSKDGLVFASGIGLQIQKVSSPGKYKLLIQDRISSCTIEDSVIVHDASKIYQLKLDSVAEIGCSDKSLEINAKIESSLNFPISQQTFDIKWFYEGLPLSTKSLALVAKNEGKYTLSLYDKNTHCEIKDSLLVRKNLSKPQLKNLKIKHENCFNSQDGQLSFDVKSDTLFKVMINNKMISQIPFSAENLISANYRIEVIDNKGCSLDTIIKINKANEIKIETDAEIEVEYKTEILLKAKVNMEISDLEEYGWGPEEDVSCIQCFETYVKADTNKILMFSVRDKKGCQDTAYTRLRVIKTPHVYAPNIISLSSTENSHFSIFANEHILKINKLSIFDRWGNMIWNKENFEINDSKLGWNGSINGQLALEGVYTFCSLLQVFDGSEKKYCGDVTVLR